MKKARFSGVFLPALAVVAQAVTMIEMDAGGKKVMAASNIRMTLYTFRKDVENVSNSNDDCAVKWPPFVATEDAKAQGGMTVIERKDGSYKWALSGKRLFFRARGCGQERCSR